MKNFLLTILLITTFSFSQDFNEGEIQIGDYKLFTLSGPHGYYEYGSASESFGVGMMTVFYEPGHWSPFSSWAISFGSTEIDGQYQDASMFRLGLGFGMMKSLSPQSSFHQVWEVQITPGYESWTDANTTQSENRWTLGFYLSPQLSFLLNRRILLGIGPFGEYHLNSEIFPKNFGGKTSLAFYF